MHNSQCWLSLRKLKIGLDFRYLGKENKKEVLLDIVEEEDGTLTPETMDMVMKKSHMMKKVAINQDLDFKNNSKQGFSQLKNI